MDNRSKIAKLYMQLYHDDQALKQLFSMMDEAKAQRLADLVTMDKNERSWYFDQSIVGMTLYTDLFAGSLKKLKQKITYFDDLGVSFLHLMPLLKPRDGENDGGYAVEDYRNIDPRLGDLNDFKSLMKEFRKHDIKVCIDYVINHVAKEHAWAQEALNHDPIKQAYFIMYDTDKIPNKFNLTVPEVLPDKCPGNFTYYPEIKKYVFTSFSEFQWDLNFQNPYVFNGMTDNLLYLANLGVNMIRLDAIPFMWKELGTSCRNLEPIHDLMRLLHLIKEDVCPSLALLGEAIVEPEQIVKYFGNDEHTECEVMYNANLMVDIYNAFATRDVRLLTVDANRFQIPQRGTWMNYVRCHDDIGWGFNEEAIRSFGFSPFEHKQFLIKFYGDQFAGSFAKGEMYQVNPLTKDARTNGTLASLLGLQKAIETHQVYRRDEAIRRINLAHAMILSYRGFPLIYSGDEVASLNDQSYQLDPDKKAEGRWIHRPFFDWKRAKNKDVVGTDEHAVYQMLKKLIKLRKQLPQFQGQAHQYALDLHNEHVFGVIRQNRNHHLFALYNFSELTQKVPTEHLRQMFNGVYARDVVQGRIFNLNDAFIELSPYEFVWCVKHKLA